MGRGNWVRKWGSCARFQFQIWEVGSHLQQVYTITQLAEDANLFLIKLLASFVYFSAFSYRFSSHVKNSLRVVYENGIFRPVKSVGTNMTATTTSLTYACRPILSVPRSFTKVELWMTAYTSAAPWATFSTLMKWGMADSGLVPESTSTLAQVWARQTRDWEPRWRRPPSTQRRRRWWRQ